LARRWLTRCGIGTSYGQPALQASQFLKGCSVRAVALPTGIARLPLQVFLADALVVAASAGPFEIAHETVSGSLHIFPVYGTLTHACVEEVGGIGPPLDKWLEVCRRHS